MQNQIVYAIIIASLAIILYSDLSNVRKVELHSLTKSDTGRENLRTF